MHPAIDVVWRCPCLPRLRVAMTPCYSDTLGGLSVLVGSLTYPSPGRMFEPSCFGRLWCHEAGLTYRPLLALPGLCYHACPAVNAVAPVASSDRHSVALALSSSLSVATDPLLLRYAWWSSSLGWFLNLSLQRMNVMTFLIWTLDLSVLNTPPGLWLRHLRPWLVCVVLCPCSLLCYSHLIVTAHPAVLVIVWNRAM